MICVPRGTDNLGKTEHRGLTTRIDLGYADGDTDQVTGTYDTAGTLAQENLPGGYSQTWTNNIVGQATALTYSQTNGTTTTPILGFTQTYDHAGRVVTSTGPGGSQRYSYDDRARLTRVQDTGTEGCTTRSYTFTGDSNRTNLTSYTPDGDGACQTNTAISAASYSYDGRPDHQQRLHLRPTRPHPHRAQNTHQRSRRPPGRRLEHHLRSQ